MLRSLCLGTTALVLLSSAGSAQAAERLSLSVGGYMTQWFGYASVDDDGNPSLDTDGLDVKSDTEIFFASSTVLDNGIEFGINVQLEGNTDSDQIDESYMIVKGSFGELNIGDENSAMYKLHVKPPQYGLSTNDGDHLDWVLSDATSISNSGFSRAPFGETALEPGRANDSTKITYYTPRLAGFRLGASYSPDANQDDNSPVDRDNRPSDGVMVGVNFDRTFGAAVVKASAGYGTFLETASGGDEPEAYNFGLVVGYGGFELGAAFASADGSGSNDGDAWNLGAAYSSGPFGVSLAYFHGERAGIGGSTAPGSAQADHNTIQLAGAYDLGPGVALQATLGYTEFSSDTAGVGDVTATYVVTGIDLSF